MQYGIQGFILLLLVGNVKLYDSSNTDRIASYMLLLCKAAQMGEAEDEPSCGV